MTKTRRRLWIALVTASSIVALPLALPAPAQAAVDPLVSLKGQIAKRHAVRVVELGGLLADNLEIFAVEQRGTVRLGGAGVGAADMTRTLRPHRRMRDQMAEGRWNAEKVAAEAQPNRSITVNGRLYRSGKLYEPVIPEGKTWVEAGTRSAATAAYGDQPINLFEPATLKTLLAKATTKRPSKYGPRKKATYYQGAIMFNQLHAVSPTFRAVVGGRSLTAAGNTKISWKFRLDDLGQALMLHTNWPLSGGRLAAVLSQYSHAADHAGHVSAPRPALVAAASSLTGTLPRPSALIDLSFPSRD
ncbi:hypothetical protein AB0K21_16465 [Streptosporangium sp. NPDC049248]|uniref:hypothetical protein n=1 Tax=Streptosporangium sp. NPDC049248 TaxID=3155651 RepID=UPI003420A386